MALPSTPRPPGWSGIAVVGALLGVLVVAQLPAASAADAPGTGAGTGVGAARSLADVDATHVSRRPAARPSASSPVVPARPAPVAASRTTSARPAASRPAVAKSATVRPAAKPAGALCSGTGWQQRRGGAALASLRGGAGRSGFRVDFAAARAGVLGLTYLDERRIAVFVRPCGTQSAELLRHVLAHELGHAQDTRHLSASSRRAWLVRRGIPAGTPWYGCDGCADFATPAGDFAEVYAQWARGATTNRSRLAGDVPLAELQALAARFFGA